MNRGDLKDKDTKGGGQNPLVYVLAAIVAGFIFICWIYLLPYILKNNETTETQNNNFQKVNKETIDTLGEIKGLIKDIGEKIQELKQATSTQSARIVNTEVDVNLLKEKILEYGKK